MDLKIILKKASISKKGKQHIPCRYSISMISAFVENKHDV